MLENWSASQSYDGCNNTPVYTQIYVHVQEQFDRDDVSELRMKNNATVKIERLFNIGRKPQALMWTATLPEPNYVSNIQILECDSVPAIIFCEL